MDNLITELNQEIVDNVNRLIYNWMKERKEYAQGAYQAYYFNGDPNKTIFVDVETADGGVSTIYYEEFLNYAKKHNSEYVLEEEFCECFNKRS